jgi:hypothetical protein
MARRTRLTVLLLALGAVIAVAISRSPALAPAAPGAAPRPPAAVEGAKGDGAQQVDATGGVPDVKVDSLSEARPQPVPNGRNPFRLAPPPAPPAPAGRPPDRSTAAPPQPVVQDPPPPQAPPPIPLKFIGVVGLPGDRGKLAVLSDGRFVYHGREGAIIEGRYRILRIGEQSIELEHADGRGRQTIRLSGS